MGWHGSVPFHRRGSVSRGAYSKPLNDLSHSFISYQLCVLDVLRVVQQSTAVLVFYHIIACMGTLAFTVGQFLVVRSSVATDQMTGSFLIYHFSFHARKRSAC